MAPMEPPSGVKAKSPARRAASSPASRPRDCALGNAMPWRRRLQPIAQPLFRLFARANRGMTLGVRGVVLNGAGEVLLVEHTYMHGWHLPGGGVERGETAEAALARELVEEAGVKVIGRPKLCAVHANTGRF